MKDNKIKERIDRIVNTLQIKTAHRDSYRKSTLIERMKELHTPGASITIIDEGEIVWSQGFGVKEFGKNDTIDEKSMFLAGSISKPILALVIMKLKEKGIIDLDADVNQYLKRWKIPAVDGWQPKITMRQILSHTAGLTVDGFEGYLKSENIPTTTQILNGEHPANSPKVVVDILPGTKFRYSGGGITIAQLAIEDLLNKSFPKIIKEELFKPLNITDSTYEQDLPESMKDQIVTAHPYKNQPVAGNYYLYPEMAAAGLWTTSMDLAKITIEIQKALNDKSDFLAKETIEEMLTPQEVQLS
jgi:CubicO group peptidase (beta-lactamase class C family)